MARNKWKRRTVEGRKGETVIERGGGVEGWTNGSTYRQWLMGIGLSNDSPDWTGIDWVVRSPDFF